jgi:phage repressor protein C with HTH and peptisase S24 domain
MKQGAAPLPENAETLLAVDVNGNMMLPLYRHGDVLLVAKDVPVKFGDRVVVDSKASGLLGGTLVHHGRDKTVLIRGGNPNREIALHSDDLSFLGRIVWASQ